MVPRPLPLVTLVLWVRHRSPGTPADVVAPMFLIKIAILGGKAHSKPKCLRLSSEIIFAELLELELVELVDALCTWTPWVDQHNPGYIAAMGSMSHWCPCDSQFEGSVPTGSTLKAEKTHSNSLSWLSWPCHPRFSRNQPHPPGCWASLHDRQVVEEYNWDLWPSGCMPQHSWPLATPGPQVLTGDASGFDPSGPLFKFSRHQPICTRAVSNATKVRNSSH